MIRVFNVARFGTLIAIFLASCGREGDDLEAPASLSQQAPMAAVGENFESDPEAPDWDWSLDLTAFPGTQTLIGDNFYVVDSGDAGALNVHRAILGNPEGAAPELQEIVVSSANQRIADALSEDPIGAGSIDMKTMILWDERQGEILAARTDDLTELWHVSSIGDVHSPRIRIRYVNGTAIIAFEDDECHCVKVVSLRMEDGGILWSREFDRFIPREWNVIDTRDYVIVTDGRRPEHIWHFDAWTGDENWAYDLLSAPTIPTLTSDTPVEPMGVFGGEPGNVGVMDVRSGATIANRQLPDSWDGRFCRFSGAVMYFVRQGSEDGPERLVAYDLREGVEKWAVDLPGHEYTLIPPYVEHLDDSTLYVRTGDETLIYSYDDDKAELEQRIFSEREYKFWARNHSRFTALDLKGRLVGNY